MLVGEKWVWPKFDFYIRILYLREMVNRFPVNNNFGYVG